MSPSHAASSDSFKLPKFGRESPFARDLQARVDSWFAERNLSQRDLPRMYLKSVSIWAWFAASWYGLVLTAAPWWLKLPLAISLGLAVGGIGMAVMHDANHGAYSRSGAVNRWIGYSLDCMGASSFVWRTKHNMLHHTWTNVGHVDDDLELGVLSRMSPHQRWLPVHRGQHIYMWLLYALLVPKWWIFDDFYNIATGRVGPLPLPRLKPRDWVVLLAGKLSHLMLGLVVPLAMGYSWSWVLGGYLLVNAVAGVTLASTFQLAHCVDAVEIVQAPADGRMAEDWASHQLRTTMDFAPRNRVLSWYLGGLNFQVVHHLFPKVCHLYYPELARLVRETARDHGLQYIEQPRLIDALMRHYRWLQHMGRRPAAT
jgi:linoleoyl-CoA desaturase